MAPGPGLGAPRAVWGRPCPRPACGVCPWSLALLETSAGPAAHCGLLLGPRQQHRAPSGSLRLSHLSLETSKLGPATRRPQTTRAFSVLSDQVHEHPGARKGSGRASTTAQPPPQREGRSRGSGPLRSCGREGSLGRVRPQPSGRMGASSPAPAPAGKRVPTPSKHKP